MAVSAQVDRSDAASLRIRHLSKTFTGPRSRHEVLADLQLLVEGGTFVTILGPSGCGKSTLLRIIGGLEVPDARPETELILGDAEIRGPGPDRGFVFQSYSSFPWLTAQQNVMFGLQFGVLDRSERERIARSYLELVGLLDHADFYPRDLSGGQQQRIAIARTLATQPRLLLMDEPFAALDALNREYQQAELLRVWQETKPTILFVTHDIAEAVFLGTRVIVMSQRPATILADVDVEAEWAARLGSDRPASRGPWLRERPEFYELVAELKRRLPTRDLE